MTKRSSGWKPISPNDLLRLYRALVAEGHTDCYEMDWPFELRHLNEKGYGLFIEIPETKDTVRPVTDPATLVDLPPISVGVPIHDY